MTPTPERGQDEPVVSEEIVCVQIISNTVASPHDGPVLVGWAASEVWLAQVAENDPELKCSLVKRGFRVLGGRDG